MNIVTEKKCSICNIVKPITDFHHLKSGVIESRCKICQSKQASLWGKMNKERKSANTKRWIAENAERVKNKVNQWKENHRETIKAYKRKYNEKHPDGNRERSLRWARANPEKRKTSIEKWIKKHPDKRREYNQTRRAKKLEVGGTITEREWKSLLDKCDNKCLKCGSTKKLTLDHVVPVSAGGSNTIDNAQVLCQSCNSSKGTKTIDYRFW